LEGSHENQIPVININDTLNVHRRLEIDPNYWVVANTSGHWHYQAHTAIGYYLSKRFIDLIPD